MIRINKVRFFKLKKIFSLMFYSGENALRVPSGLHFFPMYWSRQGGINEGERSERSDHYMVENVLIRKGFGVSALNYLKFFTILIILFGGLFFKVSAQNKLYDSNDILEIISPEPNKNIKGQTEIRFKVFDDNQPTINYTLKLFDPLTCGDSYYGQINTNATTASSSDLDTVIKWNGISTTEESILKDGRYCLNLCVSLKKAEEAYSACSARVVTILNNNSLPQIKSSPSKTVINSSEDFNYQIVAEDPDNDPIQYRLIQTPDFLKINSETGVITSNSNKKINNTEKSVIYKVMIEATDNISGSVYQRFDLTVNGDGLRLNSPMEITIIKPLGGSIVAGSNEEIIFQIADPDGIKKAVIEVSNDLSKWSLVGEVTDIESNKEKSSSFNATLFADGEYYLKLTAEDNLESLVSKTSESFFIRNNPVELKPQLTNLSPENLAVIYIKNPVIKGDIVKGISEIDLDSFKLEIDSKQIDSSICEVTQTSFLCNLKEELLAGRHNIVASIKDISGETATSQWVFDIAEATGGVINILGRSFTPASLGVLLLIACLFAVILIVPWILYSLWKRQKNKVEIKEDIELENFDLPELSFDTNLPQTTVTANYYNPESITPAEGMQPSGWVQEEQLSALPVIEPTLDKMDTLTQKTEEKPVENQPVDIVPEESVLLQETNVPNQPVLDSNNLQENFESKSNSTVPFVPEINTNEYSLPEILPDLPVSNETQSENITSNSEIMPSQSITETLAEKQPENTDNIPVLDQYSIVNQPALPNNLETMNVPENLGESQNVINNLSAETLPKLEKVDEHVAATQEGMPVLPFQPAQEKEGENSVPLNNSFLEDYPELNFDEDFNLPPLPDANSIPETLPANGNNLDIEQNSQTWPVLPAVVPTIEPEQQNLNNMAVQPQNDSFADLYPELTKETPKEESGNNTITN